MHIKAAVLYEPNQPLIIDDLELDEPLSGEVLVRMVSTGVCRSDYHAMKGEWTVPLPIVLGHEAAGVVEQVGPDVTLCRPGDHVVLNFRPNCGWCKYCINGRPVLCNGSDTPRYGMFDGTVRLHKGDVDVYHYARIATFGAYSVVPQTAAVVVRRDMPLDKACLIGCCVTTGVGAAINTAKVEAGSTVVVIGCGGVGLNVIQGAALAGAERIIAVDSVENKLAYARQFGATDVVDASSGDVVGRVREMTDGGADYAFEAFGSALTYEQACEVTRPGGVTTLVGMPPENDRISLNALTIPRLEKTITGSYYGSARPWTDIPRMIDLYMAGKIKVDELVTRTYPLSQMNEAYEALENGEVARSIVLFDS